MDELENILELGDIVTIQSPHNVIYHEQTFLISYLDLEQEMELVNITTLDTYTLLLNLENIQGFQFTVLNRSEKKGYAKQNGLEKNVWVNLEFGGDVKWFLTGEIVDVIEDCITVRVFKPVPNILIYIDFEYKGLPKKLNLEKVCVRERPESKKVESKEDELEKELEEGIQEKEDISEENESEENESEKYESEKVTEEIDFFDLDHFEIQQDNTFLEKATTKKNVRYNLEVQVNDLLEDYLSRLSPSQKNTHTSLKRIFILISRFKELRSEFSNIDQDQIIRKVSFSYRPIIEYLSPDMNNPFKWILPVVPCKRNLYNFAIENDESYDIIEELNEEEEIINNIRDTGIHDTPYERLARDTRSFNLSYEEPLEKYQSVKKDLDIMIVDEDSDDLNSAGLRYKKSKEEGDPSFDLVETQFVLQRFQSKITYPSGLKSELRTLMDAEKITLPSSFLILPQPFLFSTFRESQTLYEKIKYKIPFLFQQDFENRIQKNTTDEHFHSFPLMNKVSQIMFPKDDTTYESVVESLFPNLNQFIKNAIPFTANIHSFLEYLELLEMFKIFPNTLTKDHVTEIEKVLKKNNQTKNAEIEESNRKNKLFSEEISLTKYQFDPKTILAIDTPYSKSLGSHSKSYSEFLNAMSLEDNMSLFSYTILTTVYDHILNMEDYIKTFTFQQSNSLFTNQQQKRLTKKYTQLLDLREDNGKKTLIYDKEFDKIEYESILKPYDLKTKSEQEKKTVLMEHLPKDFGCSYNDLERLVEILLRGNQIITEGDYAVLLWKQDDKISKRFYKRIQDHWVYDMDVDETTKFANSFLCKMDFKKRDLLSEWKIQYSDEKKKYYWLHTPTKEISWEPPSQINEIIPNLKEIFNADMDAIKSNIEKELEKGKQRILKNIDRSKLLLVDSRANKLGNETLHTKVLTISPFLKLREMLFHKSIDFSTRQNMTIHFYETYCREPVLDADIPENEYWKYCRETNTKLLESSIYDLAIAYVKGKYTETLNQICSKQGVKGDDGNTIVDKHCGNVLQVMSFVSETYIFERDNEDGYQMIEEDQIEDDDDEQEMEAIKKNKKVRIQILKFHNDDEKKVFYIMKHLCFHLDVAVESIQSKVMKFMEIAIPKLAKIYSMKKFITDYEKTKKKELSDTEKEEEYEKYKIEYEKHKKKELFYTTVASVILAIQTNIPNIQKRKTFSNCTFSFDGYPLGEKSDVSTIAYFECVLLQSFKNEYAQELKKCAASLTSKLDNLLLKYLYWNPFLIAKKEYLLVREDILPISIRLETRWSHFQPILIPNKEKENPISVISDEIHNEVIKTMKKGHFDQWKYLAMYEAKIKTFSLGIWKAIDAIVKKEVPIFTTFANVPYLMNACCNESLPNPFSYFQQKNEQVFHYYKNTEKISNELRKYKQILSTLLLCPKIIPPKPASHALFSSFKESLLYRTFISYSKLESKYYPPPSYLYPLFGKQNPLEIKENFPKKSSLEEKIQYLKDHEIHFTTNKKSQMISLVNQHNKIPLHTDLTMNIENVLLTDWETKLLTMNDMNQTTQMNIWKLKGQELLTTLRTETIRMKKTVDKIIGKPLQDVLSFITFPSFCKNILYLFCIYFPSRISISRKKYSQIHERSYWNILEKDELKLTAFITKQEDRIQKFFQPVFQHFMQHIVALEDLKLFYALFEHFYLEDPLFHEYCIYFVLSYFLQKNVMFVPFHDLENEEEDNDNDQNKSLQSLVTLFLKDSLLYCKEQENRHYEYENIIRNYEKEANIEKEKMKKHFSDIKDDKERKLEKELKKFHLGIFDIDQKVLQKYGKDRDKMLENMEPDSSDNEMDEEDEEDIE